MALKGRSALLLVWECLFFPLFVVAVLVILRYAAKASGGIEPRAIGPLLATYALGRMVVLLYPVELLFKRHGVVQYSRNQIESIELCRFDYAEFATLQLKIIMLSLICLVLWLLSVTTASRAELPYRWPLAFGIGVYMLVGLSYAVLWFAPRIPLTPAREEGVDDVG